MNEKKMLIDKDGLWSRKLVTTGLLEFVECPKHSAKDIKHSANGSPNVTLGE